MMNDLGLKKCVVNNGEFEFQYSRFGEIFNNSDYGEELNKYDIILTIDTDLPFNTENNFIEKIFPLMAINIESLTFYDIDGETVIATLTGYDKIQDVHTDLVKYGNLSNYRGTLRFGKIILK